MSPVLSVNLFKKLLIMQRYTSLLWNSEKKTVLGKNAVSWMSIFLGSVVVALGVYVIIYTMKQAKREYQEANDNNEPHPFFHRNRIQLNTDKTPKASINADNCLLNAKNINGHDKIKESLANKNKKRRKRHLEHLQMELPLKNNNALSNYLDNISEDNVKAENKSPKDLGNLVKEQKNGNFQNSSGENTKSKKTNVSAKSEESKENTMKHTGAIPKTTRKPTYLTYETEEEVEDNVSFKNQEARPKPMRKFPEKKEVTKAKSIFKKISNETKTLFRADKYRRSDRKRLINSPILPKKNRVKAAQRHTASRKLEIIRRSTLTDPSVTKKSIKTHGFRKFLNKVLNAGKGLPLQPNQEIHHNFLTIRRKPRKVPFKKLDVVFEHQEVEFDTYLEPEEDKSVMNQNGDVKKKE
ncbi:uncharacterized protein LOC126748531 isoform X2 [Anthonomus grandis grandis]|uniref:uncharacterized protein LOC126748531 isoform X2 n=1 Tax=Anthonomus grandis grandis TaxID=2921223 RepID=UPI0021656F31|nr:uncharacterized protein LOC126748531 isoform X2 [Anthonomus grandis grandis]